MRVYLENKVRTSSRADVFILGCGWLAKVTIHNGLLILKYPIINNRVLVPIINFIPISQKH